MRGGRHRSTRGRLRTKPHLRPAKVTPSVHSSALGRSRPSARRASARASLADYGAWRVFARHVLDGRSYRAILEEYGVTPSRTGEERLAVASRRVLRAVRAELRAVLREDGVAEGDLDAEVARLSEGFGR